MPQEDEVWLVPLLQAQEGLIVTVEAGENQRDLEAQQSGATNEQEPTEDHEKDRLVENLTGKVFFNILQKNTLFENPTWQDKFKFAKFLESNL